MHNPCYILRFFFKELSAENYLEADVSIIKEHGAKQVIQAQLVYFRNFLKRQFSFKVSLFYKKENENSCKKIKEIFSSKSNKNQLFSTTD